MLHRGTDGRTGHSAAGARSSVCPCLVAVGTLWKCQVAGERERTIAISALKTEMTPMCDSSGLNTKN